MRRIKIKKVKKILEIKVSHKKETILKIMIIKKLLKITKSLKLILMPLGL